MMTVDQEIIELERKEHIAIQYLKEMYIHQVHMMEMEKIIFGGPHPSWPEDHITKVNDAVKIVLETLLSEENATSFFEEFNGENVMKMMEDESYDGSL